MLVPGSDFLHFGGKLLPECCGVAVFVVVSEFLDGGVNTELLFSGSGVDFFEVIGNGGGREPGSPSLFPILEAVLNS